MGNILFEMHQAEGALQAQNPNLNSPEAKKFYFNQILKKYKVSQADFDSSLVWYTKHPIEFGDLYTNILTRMDTLSAEVERGKFHPAEAAKYGLIDVDIWNLRRSYKLTKDSTRTKISFEINNTGNLLTGDKYTLSFLRRVAPSDSSINPYIVLRINYDNGKSDSIYTKTYNDSLLRRYKLTFKARDSLRIKSLSGDLLGNKVSKGVMAATLDSIKLIRQFNIYNQSKIQTRINFKDKVLPKIESPK